MARGQAELFPVDSTDDSLPVVRPLALATRGRLEFTGRCPGCDEWHRHVHLGTVTGPCGTRYNLQPRGRQGRAA
jgi:hypothetical protein